MKPMIQNWSFGLYAQTKSLKIQWVQSVLGHWGSKISEWTAGCPVDDGPTLRDDFDVARLRTFQNTQVQVSHEEMKELPLTTNMQIFKIPLGFLPVSPSSSDHKNHEESLLILGGNAFYPLNGPD